MNPRDEKGRFISPRAEELLKQSEVLRERAVALSKQAECLIQTENSPPGWLKQAIIAFASACGVSPEDFAERVKLIHPTPDDPAILIDGKAVFSYV